VWQDFDVRSAPLHLNDIIRAIEIDNGTATMLLWQMFIPSIERSIHSTSNEPGCEVFPDVAEWAKKAYGELCAGRSEAALRYLKLAIAEFEKPEDEAK
jgi:hypothetical protein